MQTKASTWAAASGALFGIGLTLAGMSNPRKVMAFLDITGDWDPSLAFVMVGAISVYAILSRVINKARTKPMFEPAFSTPTSKVIDKKLVAGAALFGLGWGLAGYCPGPGLLSVASVSGAVFIGTMVLGFALHRVVTKPSNAAAHPTSPLRAERLPSSAVGDF